MSTSIVRSSPGRIILRALLLLVFGLALGEIACTKSQRYYFQPGKADWMQVDKEVAYADRYHKSVMRHNHRGGIFYLNCSASVRPPLLTHWRTNLELASGRCNGIIELHKKWGVDVSKIVIRAFGHGHATGNHNDAWRQDRHVLVHLRWGYPNYLLRHESGILVVFPAGGVTLDQANQDKIDRYDLKGIHSAMALGKKRVRIHGFSSPHRCNYGAADCLQQSIKRAMAVGHHLIQRGVLESQIEIVGWGTLHPNGGLDDRVLVQVQ